MTEVEEEVNELAELKLIKKNNRCTHSVKLILDMLKQLDENNKESKEAPEKRPFYKNWLWSGHGEILITHNYIYILFFVNVMKYCEIRTFQWNWKCRSPR